MPQLEEYTIEDCIHESSSCMHPAQQDATNLYWELRNFFLKDEQVKEVNRRYTTSNLIVNINVLFHQPPIFNKLFLGLKPQLNYSHSEKSHPSFSAEYKGFIIIVNIITKC